MNRDPKFKKSKALVEIEFFHQFDSSRMLFNLFAPLLTFRAVDKLRVLTIEEINKEEESGLECLKSIK